MSQKLNCWEFKRCGRAPGGAHVGDRGVCPAATEQRLDEIHGGRNGGRACWVVAGTFCKSEIQGSFAAKFDTCEKCDFYQKVRQEEWPRFTLSVNLLKKLD